MVEQLLADISAAGCTVVVQGEQLRMRGRCPPQLLARCKLHRDALLRHLSRAHDEHIEFEQRALRIFWHQARIMERRLT